MHRWYWKLSTPGNWKTFFAFLVKSKSSLFWLKFKARKPKTTQFLAGLEPRHPRSTWNWNWTVKTRQQQGKTVKSTNMVKWSSWSTFFFPFHLYVTTCSAQCCIDRSHCHTVLPTLLLSQCCPLNPFIHVSIALVSRSLLSTAASYVTFLCPLANLPATIAALNGRLSSLCFAGFGLLGLLLLSIIQSMLCCWTSWWYQLNCFADLRHWLSNGRWQQVGLQQQKSLIGLKKLNV